MTGEDLTPTQARKIYDALQPTLGFLSKLERRLIEIGFSANDPYFEKVAAAHEAFHRLAVETHYLTCSGGVGKLTRETREVSSAEK